AAQPRRHGGRAARSGRAAARGSGLPAAAQRGDREVSPGPEPRDGLHRQHQRHDQRRRKRMMKTQHATAEADLTETPTDEHIAPAPRISVQAFCDTVETAAAIQAAGEDRRLVKAHLRVQMGGITAAAEAYRSSPTPNVIMIESEARAS